MYQGILSAPPAYRPAIACGNILVAARLGAFIALIAYTGSAWAQDSAERQPMSLNGCLTYALAHNRNLIDANLNVEAGRRRTEEVLATGLPQLSAEASFDYNFERPFSYLPAEFTGGPPGTFVPIQFSTPYLGRAAINLDQMIFRGSFFVGIRASKAYVNQRVQEVVKTKVDVMETVTKAYYLVLVNYEQRRLVEKTFTRLDSLLRQTRLMNEAGFSEQAEVDRITVQFNNAKVEQENFDRRLELSYALLKFQMGMEVNEPLLVAERIEDIRPNIAIPTDADNEFDYRNRIEYMLQETAINLTTLDIKNSQSGYLPALNLRGSYGANTGTQTISDLFNFGKNWNGLGSIGISISIPIFDGFSKARVIQQKKIQLLQLENGRERIRQDIDVQILRAKTDWEKAARRVKAQEENMRLAERVYRSAALKYEAGVGSTLEVIDADAALVEAQINYQSALYDALVAKVDLDKAYGLLLK